MPWAFLVPGTHAGGREGLSRTDLERGHLGGSDIIWIIGGHQLRGVVTTGGSPNRRQCRRLGTGTVARACKGGPEVLGSAENMWVQDPPSPSEGRGGVPGPHGHTPAHSKGAAPHQVTGALDVMRSPLLEDPSPGCMVFLKQGGLAVLSWHSREDWTQLRGEKRAGKGRLPRGSLRPGRPSAPGLPGP